MRVRVALFGPLREAAGQKYVDVEVDSPATVREVIGRLVRQEPGLEGQVLTDDGDLQSITVTVNGEHIQQRDGLETSVGAGDLLRIALPVRGGRRAAA